MDSYFSTGGGQPAALPTQSSEPAQPQATTTPRRQSQIQGPRPSPLRVHQDSHRIKKPPLPPPRQQPVIIYAVSPKVIHTEVADFMKVVQRLTGLSSGDFSNDGDISPAARLAATERASPKERSGNTTIDGSATDDNIMGIIEGVDVSQVPGILSPAPGMLPPVPSGFFSPATDPSTLPYFNEINSPLFFHGGSNGGGGGFMASPSALLTSSLISPLASPDIFNLLMDF